MASHAAVAAAPRPVTFSPLHRRRGPAPSHSSALAVPLPLRRRLPLPLRAASSTAPAPAPVEADGWDTLDRLLGAVPDCAPLSASGSAAGAVMKGPYGSSSSVTLEKSKLDLSQKQAKSSPELATGGGGGDIGKKNFHGGGDGGDDGGDDDDYFDDWDEGDEGDENGLFRRRLILQELFDRKFVDAVLQEWYKTMANLPAGLRQAYEMGLVSSAQMVRFLSMTARPTTSRFISRALPQPLSRAFIGRMIADPSFLYKLLFEQFATISSSLWWELKNRKERIKQEWDLALINVLTASACNAFVVWSLAPSRSYGNTFSFDLQNTVQKLPNNIFEKSYPMREFDMQKRAYSFFYKAAEFSLVGLLAGSIQGALSKSLSTKKEGRLSVTIPTVTANSFGYGGFLGLYANLRYQLLCGLDRSMFDHFDVLGVAMVSSIALRMLNVHIGEISRRAWLGVESDPLLESDNLLAAYNRPSEAVSQPFSNWFISKNAIVSGLGLLGIKQGSGESDGAPKKAPRKRVVKKKVSTSTI